MSTTQAIGFAVLGYLDQNLTSVIVNRPSNNLQKPPGYHLEPKRQLDFLELSIFLVEEARCLLVLFREGAMKLPPRTCLCVEHSHCLFAPCWACHFP